MSDELFIIIGSIGALMLVFVVGAMVGECTTRDAAFAPTLQCEKTCRPYAAASIKGVCHCATETGWERKVEK